MAASAAPRRWLRPIQAAAPSVLLRAASAADRRLAGSLPRRWLSRPGAVRCDSSYQLDAGDKLRVVVYGQEGLTNTYAIGAGGSITMPLIGSVPARGLTPAGLAADITARLRDGFIREPSVAVGGRSLPAVLHSRRSRGARPVSVSCRT